MLAKRLKLLREKQGKGQQEVCAALNIEQSTLANYENGKRIPKIDILIKIARYYNVSTDYLLGIVQQTIPYGVASYSGQNEYAGKNIAYWIFKSNFGYDEIANMLGISEDLLEDYCNGESVPLNILIKLSEICEVSTDCLLGLRKKPRPKQDGDYPFQFDPEISRRLKEQMQQMGENYSQIAAVIGIEEEEVFNFLEYGFVPHIAVFIQIAEHFLVSSDFLLNRTNSTLTIQEDEDELLRSYRALNAKSKTMALSRIYELEREESLVAAKNPFLDNEGKSLPSNGTEGDTIAG